MYMVRRTAPSGVRGVWDMENQFLQEEDTQHGRYLSFHVDKEVYALEIRYVTEIVGIQPITVVPESPDYVRGIINLRGSIIPVIDVRLKFRKAAIDYTDRTCIIVIDIAGSAVGLIVDQVAEVVDIPDEDIAPPPGVRTGMQARYISGIGKVEGDVKLLLDCQKLFSDEELENITAVE